MIICLSSGCSNQVLQNGRFYKQQKFVFHSSESWKSKIGVTAHLLSSESPFLDYKWPDSLYILTWQKESKLSEVLSMRSLISFMRSLHLWPNYIPKTLPPNTITLGVRFQHTNLERRHRHLFHCILTVYKDFKYFIHLRDSIMKQWDFTFPIFKIFLKGSLKYFLYYNLVISWF